MDTRDTILSGIEPDITATIVTRREAIRKGATVGSTVAAGLALGSIPVALAALSREAYAQTPGSVQDVLNFALMLEIFENEFYKAVLGTSSSSAQNAAFAPVRATVPASALPALQKIQQHEAQHVAFLLANGATNVLNLSATTFDFTGNRSAAGGGPFAGATTNLAFLLLVAQAAEDTGVRAYKGQAGNLMSNSLVLEAALRIHSVEARHAAKIRRLRRSTGATAVKFSGTVTGTGAAAAGSNVSNPPATVVTALDLIYANEGTVTQGGVDVSTATGLPSSVNVTAAAQEAFDEPLTKDQVRTIVQPFFIPTIP